MAIIGFAETAFKPHPSDERLIRGWFYERYYFDLTREELDALGTWRITPDEDLEFLDVSEKKAWNKVSRIVERGMSNLTHALYEKPTIYIHENSGIPLIGSNEFGVVDRGSNILEVKPLTGCNFNCPHCSVDEGKNRKTHDYVVELEYLLTTVRWVAATKKHPVEVNIGPQGEPLLYPKFIELVQGLNEIPEVEIISVNTNGSLLSEKLIDQLAKAGLARINLSVNALEQGLANELAGTAYPLERIKKLIPYITSKGIALLIAPVVVPTKNEAEIPKIVRLSSTIHQPEGKKFPTIGVQNYLEYPKGRRPVKQWDWKRFSEFIEEVEQETGVDLSMKKEDFQIFDEPELPKPFHKDDTINATIVMPGRYPNELVATSNSNTHESARNILVVNLRPENMERIKIGRHVKLKIIRDKHNIYKGRIVK